MSDLRVAQSGSWMKLLAPRISVGSDLALQSTSPQNLQHSSMKKAQNTTAARLTLRAPRHQNCTPLLQRLHWLPISERIKYKTACMRYNTITGSAPSYLSELLHFYSPSRSLRSSSDTRMLKTQRFNRKTHGFRTFSHFGPPHLEQSPPRHQALCHSLFLQKQTQDISLLRIFQLSNTVHHPYQSVQCVCVCVCASFA